MLAVDTITTVATLGGIYAVALWVALAFYVFRDARNRSGSASFLLFAALLGFFPPYLGALLYIIIRPPHTLEEGRALALEQQLLSGADGGEGNMRPCPSCGKDVDRDFVMCPYCKTQFARRCAVCGHALRLGWSVCPFCTADVGSQPVRASSKVVDRPAH